MLGIRELDTMELAKGQEITGEKPTMKTHIDKEVGKVFCLTLAEMEELRNCATRGLRVERRYEQPYLRQIAEQLAKYLQEGGNENPTRTG